MGAENRETRAAHTSPHVSESVNRRFIQSEIDGGIDLSRVPHGTVLEVETQNRSYTIVHQGSGDALICGHPEFCPEPVRVKITGSIWGGTMLKRLFIGRGMQLEFRHPGRPRVTTSRICAVRTIHT